MIIERVDKKRECFSDYTLSEGVLRIGGIPIDLQAEQAEQEVIITFCRCGSMVHRGMMPGCEYAAEVIIPPRRYRSEEVAVTDTPRGDTSEAEVEMEVKTHTEMVAEPLDSDTVVLQLWPIGTEYEKEPEGGM
jgi:hypothetical protein